MHSTTISGPIPEPIPEPIPVRPKLIRRFQEPIILEAALIKIRPQGFLAAQRTPNSGPDAIDDVEQAFQCFVNRLAQVCDSEQGGETVSAIAVMNEVDGVHYILGSNNRTSDELQVVEEFLTQLLELVAGLQTIPEDQISIGKKNILQYILRFNKNRVRAYLRHMLRYSGKCIVDYERRWRDDGPTSSFEKILVLLRDMTSFRDEKLEEDDFFNRCESLIRLIDRAQRSRFIETVSEYARDGEIDKSESWSEFRHYMGRLHSYHSAVETIVRTGRRMSRLFYEFKVTTIPSAPQTVGPLTNKMRDARKIIHRMMPSGSAEQNMPYQAQVQHLQQFHLDEAIQEEYDNKHEVYTVHAEVLIMDHVLKVVNGEDCLGFWNSWQFIGTSKPACRLCSLWFAYHPSGIKSRESSHNLYPHWRAPDVFDETAAKERDIILDKMCKRIRADAIRSIQSLRPQGRGHDSNSFSQIPRHLLSEQSTAASISDIVTRIEALGINGLARSYHGEDTQSIVNNAGESDDDDDEEGGVVI